MASGVGLADELVVKINKMKVNLSTDDPAERIRLLIMHIDGDYIGEEKCYLQKDLDAAGDTAEDTFKFLQSLLHNEQCRYILYDCHFETKESSKKEELVYIMWAPEGSPIKSKMKYASSKNAIDKVLGGVKHRLQVNDMSDIGRKEFAEKLGKAIKLEGFCI